MRRQLEEVRILCIILVKFLLAVVFLDFVAGKALECMFFKQKSGAFHRANLAISETKAELLIFGSSRANHHYVPDILFNSLKMTNYNVGRDGCFIPYHYAVLQMILKRYTPKEIVLDVTPEDIYEDTNEYERLALILPYYNKHPELKPILELRSKFEKIKLLSNIYPYNSSFVTILAGYFNLNRKKENDLNGFIPLKGKIRISKPSKEEVRKLDYRKVNLLRDFIRKCKANSVKLIIVYSPNYKLTNHNEKFVESFVCYISEREKVDFLNFQDHKKFLDSDSLFYDDKHLNYKGAEMFSGLFVDEVMKINSK